MNGMQSKSVQVRGFTRRELLTIIAVISALFVLLLLPAIGTARDKARRASCTSRLVQIGIAFRTWSSETNNLYPMSALTNRDGSLQIGGLNPFRAFQVMSNELNSISILVCPADKRRPARSFDKLTNTNLSFFIGRDADETQPAMPLAGDRNLVTNGVAVPPGLLVMPSTNPVDFSAAMHKFSGNVGLSDGSVQQVSSAGLQTLLQRSGTNTIRLIVP